VQAKVCALTEEGTMIGVSGAVERGRAVFAVIGRNLDVDIGKDA
jgi:hypothetical protein